MLATPRVGSIVSTSTTGTYTPMSPCETPNLLAAPNLYLLLHWVILAIFVLNLNTLRPYKSGEGSNEWVQIWH